MDFEVSVDAGCGTVGAGWEVALGLALYAGGVSGGVIGLAGSPVASSSALNSLFIASPETVSYSIKYSASLTSFD